MELGFKKSGFELCVFIKTSECSLIVIALYVDDFLIFSNDPTERNKLKKKLSNKFKIKDLGEVNYCLGLNVKRNRSNHMIEISQKTYILDLLKKFDMTEAKGIRTPMDAKLKLNRDASKENVQVPYQCLIDSLMFLVVNSRPNISFAVSYLSQFNKNHQMEYWRAAKRILRYLKETIDVTLNYRQSGKNVKGFADADWANNITDHKLYTGYVFILGDAAISWEFKK